MTVLGVFIRFIEVSWRTSKMKEFLGSLLICPKCKSDFKLEILSKNSDEISKGCLSCKCGTTYPIINSIPRILDKPSIMDPKFESLKEKTKKSFGYQWTAFSEMACNFEENFMNYIWPVEPTYFKGKLGLDVGCGFGRHIYNAAVFGAKMVGVDISEAIDSAQKNTHTLDNVHLVQSDIYNMPLRKESFDFVYSIGVLHHLPDPEKGFQALLPLARPGGAIFVWVYSSKRKITIFFLEILRRITCKLPFGFTRFVSFIAASIDYCLFILPYKILSKVPFAGRLLSKVTFQRIKVYQKYPFQVIYADWFDRLSPPLRFYYDKPDIEEWFKKAGLKDIRVTPTGLYGWRGYGVKAK